MGGASAKASPPPPVWVELDVVHIHLPEVVDLGGGVQVPIQRLDVQMSGWPGDQTIVVCHPSLPVTPPITASPCSALDLPEVHPSWGAVWAAVDPGLQGGPVSVTWFVRGEVHVADRLTLAYRIKAAAPTVVLKPAGTGLYDGILDNIGAGITTWDGMADHGGIGWWPFQWVDISGGSEVAVSPERPVGLYHVSLQGQGNEPWTADTPGFTLPTDGLDMTVRPGADTPGHHTRSVGDPNAYKRYREQGTLIPSRTAYTRANWDSVWHGSCAVSGTPKWCLPDGHARLVGLTWNPHDYGGADRAIDPDPLSQGGDPLLVAASECDGQVCKMACPGGYAPWADQVKYDFEYLQSFVDAAYDGVGVAVPDDLPDPVPGEPEPDLHLSQRAAIALSPYTSNVATPPGTNHVPAWLATCGVPDKQVETKSSDFLTANQLTTAGDWFDPSDPSGYYVAQLDRVAHAMSGGGPLANYEGAPGRPAILDFSSDPRVFSVDVASVGEAGEWTAHGIEGVVEASTTADSTTWTIDYTAEELEFTLDAPVVLTGSADRVVYLYLGGEPNPWSATTTTGLVYGAASAPSLPFDARYHIRWQADGADTGLWEFDGSSWVDTGGIVSAGLNGSVLTLQLMRSQLGGNPSPQVLQWQGGSVDKTSGDLADLTPDPSTTYHQTDISLSLDPRHYGDDCFVGVGGATEMVIGGEGVDAQGVPAGDAWWKKLHDVWFNRYAAPVFGQFDVRPQLIGKLHHNYAAVQSFQAEKMTCYSGAAMYNSGRRGTVTIPGPSSPAWGGGYVDAERRGNRYNAWLVSELNYQYWLDDWQTHTAYARAARSWEQGFIQAESWNQLQHAVSELREANGELGDVRSYQGASGWTATSTSYGYWDVDELARYTEAEHLSLLNLKHGNIPVRALTGQNTSQRLPDGFCGCSPQPQGECVAERLGEMLEAIGPRVRMGARTLPGKTVRGTTVTLTQAFVNRGNAPTYWPYVLEFAAVSRSLFDPLGSAGVDYRVVETFPRASRGLGGGLELATATTRWESPDFDVRTVLPAAKVNPAVRAVYETGGDCSVPAAAFEDSMRSALEADENTSLADPVVYDDGLSDPFGHVVCDHIPCTHGALPAAWATTDIQAPAVPDEYVLLFRFREAHLPADDPKSVGLDLDHQVVVGDETSQRWFFYGYLEVVP